MKHSTSIPELTSLINEFCDERDWKQFHSPKDMAISINIEAAELLEHFQWKSESECTDHIRENREAVADEIADVGIYLFEMADLLGLNLGDEMTRKIGVNASKYPVKSSKGSHRKSTERQSEKDL